MAMSIGVTELKWQALLPNGEQLEVTFRGIPAALSPRTSGEMPVPAELVARLQSPPIKRKPVASA